MYISKYFTNEEIDQRLLEGYYDDFVKAGFEGSKEEFFAFVLSIKQRVMKEEGKGLSTNDFTNEYKEKIDSTTVWRAYIDRDFYEDFVVVSVIPDKITVFENPWDLQLAYDQEYGSVINTVYQCIFILKPINNRNLYNPFPELFIESGNKSLVKDQWNYVHITWCVTEKPDPGDLSTWKGFVNIEILTDPVSKSELAWKVGTGLHSALLPESGSQASGEYSVAEGYGTLATGEKSHAEGNSTEASGDISHAEGHGTKATGIYSHSEGATTKAQGGVSHAEGQSTVASGGFSHAEGFGTAAAGMYSHSEGYNTSAEGQSSHSEGQETTASGNYSHAEGNGTQATNAYAHAEGNKTISRGSASHTEGFTSETGGTATSNTKTSGTISTAGAYAHAEGNATIAKGVATHSEGKLTFASGEAAHAEGEGTESKGLASHAEGLYTEASGQDAHAEGNRTQASGNNSHAEGYKSEASGGFSHAEGNETTASGANTHSEGYKTSASNSNDHAEGNSTAASGGASHAEGWSTEASGQASHAEGLFTKTLNQGEHASGRYNFSRAMESVRGGTIFSVGNGTSESGRFNIMELTFTDALFLYGLGGYDGKTIDESTESVQDIILVDTLSNEEINNLIPELV